MPAVWCKCISTTIKGTGTGETRKTVITSITIILMKPPNEIKNPRCSYFNKVNLIQTVSFTSAALVVKEVLLEVLVQFTEPDF